MHVQQHYNLGQTTCWELIKVSTLANGVYTGHAKTENP
jgi:hypothetical protein